MSNLQEVENIITECQRNLHELANFAATGDISTKDFITQMRQEIKNAYFEQYALGIGDRELNNSDYGLVGSLVKDQYQYLEKFANDCQSGTLTPDQIQARMDMYINSSRSAYETAKGYEAFANGADEEQWICHEDEKTCPDCSGYAAQGWVQFGDLPEPGDGESECLTNCRCHKEYRKGSEE
jgi:hypothetical protein